MWRKTLEAEGEIASTSHSGRYRPAWASSAAQGHKTTGLHMFMESRPHTFETCLAEWEALPDNEKKGFIEKAKNRRHLAAAAAAKDPLEQFMRWTNHTPQRVLGVWHIGKVL